MVLQHRSWATPAYLFLLNLHSHISYIPKLNWQCGAPEQVILRIPQKRRVNFQGLRHDRCL